ncbi:MAG: hypothetical protein HC769_34405 [Cyanobacteria bacterium CRU_2_1]|nr:hypothetical protein [Cyanobacteria bacterium CRU_2_1]
MFLFKPQLASLECDRSQPDSGECKLVMSGLFGEEVTTFPVEQLKGAEVRGGRRSRQLVLLTSDERFYFPGGSGSLQNANQINDFVRDPGSQSLNLKQDSRWSAYPIGGALLLVSGVSLRLLASGFLDRSAKPSNS